MQTANYRHFENKYFFSLGAQVHRVRGINFNLMNCEAEQHDRHSAIMKNKMLDYNKGLSWN